jgi:hypothetical protein
LVLLLAALVSIGSLLIILLYPAGKETSPLGNDQEEWQTRIRKGEMALGNGDFLPAFLEFDAAQALLNRSSSHLAKNEKPRVRHLHEQAQLLADLLKDPLEEMLSFLDSCNEQERPHRFQQHYRNNSVIFYDTVQRDATGQIHIGYRLVDRHGEEARLDLNHLELFRDLPLRDPQQLLFGARLESVQRGPVRGNWVISFRSDSGVLITNQGAARACCFQPLDPDQLDEVVRKQASWVAELLQPAK